MNDLINEVNAEQELLQGLVISYVRTKSGPTCTTKYRKETYSIIVTKFSSISRSYLTMMRPMVLLARFNLLNK